VTDREIYEQVREPLMRFASSLVGPDGAHDLVAEAVTATLSSRSLSDLENPRAYLMQAVLNAARSRGRSRVREQRAMSRLSSQVSAPDAEMADPGVLDTVAGLPVRQRAAVFLVYWEDMKPTDAAEVMGVRPATLRRYLHLAREKLRRHLDD